MEILKALPSDAKHIQKVHREAVYNLPAKLFNESLKEIWTGGDAEGWVRLIETCKASYIVKYKGSIVAFATVTQSNYLKHLYVTPNLQRKGFGKKLLNKIYVDFLGEKLTLDANKHAYPFYYQQGFTPLKEHSIKMGTESVIVTQMEKQL